MAIQGRQEIGNVTINIGNPTPQTQNVGSPLTTDADDRKQISNYDAYGGYTESGLLGYQQGDIINYAPITNNTYIVSSGATIIQTGNDSGTINTLSGNINIVSGNILYVSGIANSNLGSVSNLSGSITIINDGISRLSGAIHSGNVINVMDAPWNLIPANKDASQAAATHNTLQLNRLFNSASGLQDTPLSVYFPGRSFLINDSIIIPPKTSISVLGNGLGSTLESGLSIFNNLWNGSTSSKIVWVGPTDRPMVINYGGGTRFEPVLVGYYADTNGKHTAATASTNLSPSVLTGFAQIGMLIPNQTSGLACGKMAIPYWAINFCQTGLCFGSGDFSNDNADESWIGYYYPQFCGVGIATRTTNAQLFTIGAFTPYACNTGFFISGGGNITVQHALAIASGGVLFEVGNTTVNTPLVHIGMLSIDNGFVNGRVLKMTQSPDIPKPLNFTVESMFVANGISGHPLFELRDAAMLGVNAGFGIYEGMIRFVNTTAGYNPTASLYRMRMSHTPTAQHPSGLVHSTSTGSGTITHRDAQSYFGSYFNSNRYNWVNGVQTNVTGF